MAVMANPLSGPLRLPCLNPAWPVRQCESVRQACSKGNKRCRCVIPSYLDPLRENYVMETGDTAPLGVLAMWRGTLADAR